MRSRLAAGAALAAAFVAYGATLAIPAGAATGDPSAGTDRAFRSSPDLAPQAGRAGSGPISAARLERKLDKLARQAPGASSYYVDDLSAPKQPVLFDRNADVRRKLASNEKLFTTSTALHTLGAASRIETRVKVDGDVSRGRLHGDIYLIGGGDPSLGATGVDDLAGDVRKAGIKSISGTVFGDDTVFDRLRGVPDSNYGPSPYIAPLSGLAFGGSTYSEDPAKATAGAFRDELRDAGVKVGGKVKVGSLPESLRKEAETGSYESEPLAQLVADTNKVSNNFYAEMLLKRLDATDGHQGTTRGGVADVERYARSLGSGVSARDGSGLTDNNLSSPREIVDLLAAVRDRESEEVGDPLFDSLAIAGQDGTLVDRMGGTAAAGRCRGKTGTIDGVSNLSGYCKSGSGLVAFSLLMNGVTDFEADHLIQDRMVVEIARYRP